MKTKKIILTTLILMISAYAFAGTRPGAISFRLADGYYYFAQKRNLQNTTAPTFEVGYEFTDKLGMKAGVTILNTNTQGAGYNPGVHGLVYALDGVYKFMPHGNFEPYFLAGIGITSIKTNNTQANEPPNLANVNAGIGSHYFIDESISLNGEAKDMYTMSGGKNDVMLTLGVSFFFGGDTLPVEQTPHKS